MAEGWAWALGTKQEISEGSKGLLVHWALHHHGLPVLPVPEGFAPLLMGPPGGTGRKEELLVTEGRWDQ